MFSHKWPTLLLKDCWGTSCLSPLLMGEYKELDSCFVEYGSELNNSYMILQLNILCFL